MRREGGREKDRESCMWHNNLKRVCFLSCEMYTHGQFFVHFLVLVHELVKWKMPRT